MTAQTDLRYPIGQFTPPAASQPNLRAEQIEILRQLPERLREVTAGLSDAQLDTPYREGGWTVRQVIHHIADSHANAFIRFKLTLTEDWPTVKPYKEAAWAELADSRKLPIDLSMAIITGMHARWVVLLESLSEQDFHKGYNHPEHGKQVLTTVLAMYAWHAQHHTAHISGLRARQGW
jgi:uncharacterized damage-inducible protein DinB